MSDGLFFGYIQKLRFVGSAPTELCNNPFFKNQSQIDLGLPRLVDPDELRRSLFANHSFVRLGNFYYDCCAGPILGAETFDKYYALVVDIASDNETIVKDKRECTKGNIKEEPFKAIVKTTK